MRFIYSVALIFVIAASAHGFLGKKKSGCDPNPCEHKGVCTLDKTDNMKFECECNSEYWGQTCEKKTGCHKNLFGKDPCGKHGTCSNDAENMSEYHCKCAKNFVGKNCDIEDACLVKNPCTKDSVCYLDEKFKPVCECQLGFKGKKCDESKF
jgi:hypothetical protein